ncbi:SDR family NAD(P)-dependent oxidoreductase [Halioglobus maricola]|uniref:SDR family NAD(P)-dependent oxidoreductase n=1 Tax=Halioglobus maricola TaxID=2601894 RepID=A0A5P9NI13_9GAMM|nr:SDR family NAD(P)-dependent oxidoreductase [Halioglobus maricola]QFU75166.1 SDR family NAD(P)-dependent oxidoreductase [Halioglobus maricola]
MRVARFKILFLMLMLATVARADERSLVLVTGASSGIGLAVANHLAQSGYRVLAGARSAEDMKRLNALPYIDAFALDVTSQEDVDRMVQYIREGEFKLSGVVNNAGVLIVGPAAEVWDSELDYIFGVNVRGAHRVIRAVLPLLIESGGTIVNMSSISSYMAPRMLGAYVMSKSALESYSEVMAGELAPLGVRVVSVLPGQYISNIGDSAAARVEAQEASFIESPFRAEAESTLKALQQNRRAGNPFEVAVVVESIFSSGTEGQKFVVVPRPQQHKAMMRDAIGRVLELNRNSSHPLGREELQRLFVKEHEDQ